MRVLSAPATDAQERVIALTARDAVEFTNERAAGAFIGRWSCVLAGMNHNHRALKISRIGCPAKDSRKTPRRVTEEPMGNRIPRFHAILTRIALLPCFTTMAFGQETVAFHQGDTVVVKSLGVELESQGCRFPAGKWFQLFTVQEVRGDRLRVSAELGYPTGWLKSADVVELKNASDYFSEQISRNHGSAQALALRGTVRVRLGAISGFHDLVQAMQLDPNLVLVYMGLGLMSVTRGDCERALTEFGEAIRLDPTSAWAHFCRGQVYSSADRFDEAVADLTEAIRLEPANGYLYSKRALIWRALSRNDKASSDFETGIQLAPGSPWAHTDRGNLLNERTEFKLAVIEFDEAIRLDATSYEAFTGRAIAKMNVGDLTTAMKDSNEALRIAPKDSLARGVRGAIWWKKGNFDRAMDDLNESVSMSPKSLSTRCIRGICSDQLGNFYSAIADFSEVLKYGSKNLPVYCMRAGSLARKGEFAKAKSDLDHAIGQSPEFGRAYLQRAYLF